MAINWRGGSNLPLDVASLAGGLPGVSPAFGSYLAEAASVCFDAERHTSPTSMSVDGATACTTDVSWSEPTEQARRTLGDPEVATEHGAYGIASLVVPVLSALTVVERSRKGTGFDFWLGDASDPGPLFQGRARMEVSGIRRGDDSAIRTRVKQKLAQTQQSRGAKLPAVVVVVEFGSPKCQIAES